MPHFTWEGGPSRTRLSWLTSIRWPKGIVYRHLDPDATLSGSAQRDQAEGAR